jgi:hypothetical protein
LIDLAEASRVDTGKAVKNQQNRVDNNPLPAEIAVVPKTIPAMISGRNHGVRLFRGPGWIVA